jgi:hypothetical protein
MESKLGKWIVTMESKKSKEKGWLNAAKQLPEATLYTVSRFYGNQI